MDLSTDNEALHEYFQPVSNMCNENTDVIEDAIRLRMLYGEIKNVI